MAFNLTLRKSFLYIFATLGLVLSIIGLTSMINLGLKTYVFTKSDFPCYNSSRTITKADTELGMTQAQIDEQAKQDEKNCVEQRTADKQRQASTAISMLIVGLPLYGYHWMVIRKENQI